MLLHCEMEERPLSEGACLAAGWLRPQDLESLLELNELCLALLAEQAAVPGAQLGGLLRPVGELWRGLDAGARRRAAACPYLLLDAGFADAQRWRRAALPQVGEAGHAPYSSFFTVPGAIAVGRLVLTYAWHLARTQTAAARLLLGMPAPCAALVGQCTLRQIHTLAELHPEWLKPRWPARAQVWRELLLAAASGEAGPLEQAHMHGLTLLAAESRSAALTSAAVTSAAVTSAAVTSPAGTASTAPSPRYPARP